ncbi:hypothetical protein QTI66_27700 [Variovorax sp. J22R133]|uniref:hypothetical protein n=1 Tax=Variovorax brevis TaxID=3053503 RepID=UPI00257817D8|nr:hypothetical protein [Variovorax sp. J22R133]MDM0115965.1 hypothetical protein [Variovorax sp. J22R133]
MKRGISDRESVAGVLVMLVCSRLIKSRSSKTSRTGLHALVPVSERASVRRGLIALIDHGLLAMSGEDIGFTLNGRLFLAHVQRAHHPSRAADRPDEPDPVDIDSILDAIDGDDRFDPQGPVEDVQSLPARLQVERKPKPRRSGFPTKWFVFACLFAFAAAYAIGH